MSVGARQELVLLSAVVATWTLLGGVRAAAVDEVPAEPPPTTTTTAAPTTTTAPPPPPTTVPPTTPPPTTAPPAEDPAEAAIRRWFGDVEAEARRIAWCESRFDPRAVSPRGGNRGLFQINTVHRESFLAVTGVAYDDGVLDAELNARFARWLYDRQGWEPWACA